MATGSWAMWNARECCCIWSTGPDEEDPGEAYKVSSAVNSKLMVAGLDGKARNRGAVQMRCALTEELIAEQAASLEAACGQKPLILSSASGLNVDRALRMIVRAIDKDKEDAANQVPALRAGGLAPVMTVSASRSLEKFQPDRRQDRIRSSGRKRGELKRAWLDALDFGSWQGLAIERRGRADRLLRFDRARTRRSWVCPRGR